MAISEERERWFTLSIDMMCIIGFDGSFQRINPACVGTLGWFANELQARPWTDFVHPHDRPRAIRDMQELIAGQLTSSFQNRYQCKNGSYKWIRWNASASREEGAVYVIGRDISEREEVEETLRAREAHLRAIIETEPECVKVVGLDGRLLEMNPAGLAMIEAPSAEAVIGQPVIGLVHPNDRAAWQALHDSVAQGNRDTLEFRMIGLAGTVRWMESFGVPLRNASGDILSVLSITHDITDRKRAEDALRTGEMRLQAILDHSPVLIFIKDLDGRYVRVNRRFEQVFHISNDDIVGKTDEEIFPADQASAFRCNDQTVLSRGEPVEFEEKASHDDGVHTSLVWKFPLRDSAGATYALCGIALDITERVQAQEALRTSEEQLRQAQKMEAIGRLAGGISHDFNNLLTVINGFSSAGLRHLEEGDPLRENLGMILQAGEQAAALTTQLLTISRRQVFKPAVLNLNRIIGDMHSMLQRLLGEDIDVLSTLDPNLGHVKVDPAQIHQVLMNLAVNARDAMPTGGKLTIETKNVEFTESSRHEQSVNPGHYVALCVSDNGKGMDAEIQSHVFEPFFTTKGEKGTGLGLSIVYGLVKQSDGYVFVYSEPDRGATFKIYLPRVEASVELPKIKRPTVKGPSGSETVLVVEDEPKVRSFVAQSLRGFGYKVIEARHGVEALVVSGQHSDSIHLLLTDVVMPQMGGREVANELLPSRPGMKVLFMSGYTDDAIVHHGVLDPGMAFLQKPFSTELLVQKVRDVLASSAA